MHHKTAIVPRLGLHAGQHCSTDAGRCRSNCACLTTPLRLVVSVSCEGQCSESGSSIPWTARLPHQEGTRFHNGSDALQGLNYEISEAQKNAMKLNYGNTISMPKRRATFCVRSWYLNIIHRNHIAVAQKWLLFISLRDQLIILVTERSCSRADEITDGYTRTKVSPVWLSGTECDVGSGRNIERCLRPI